MALVVFKHVSAQSAQKQLHSTTLALAVFVVAVVALLNILVAFADTPTYVIVVVLFVVITISSLWYSSPSPHLVRAIKSNSVFGSVIGRRPTHYPRRPR